MMGSEQGQDNEKPIRQVEITKPYYLSRYPVTQVQWEAVKGTNPSNFKGENHPVELVSWHDVQAFCDKLGADYRLPTEAEWEYACRSGTSTAYSFGDNKRDLEKHAWYRQTSQGKTNPVGQKKKNPWGLNDMHGNVWEWVQDWYATNYYHEAAKDPQGPKKGKYRVIRGGSWYNDPASLRSASRNGWSPVDASTRVGFRLLKTID